MNEIALLLVSSGCVIYSIWLQTKVECLQERIAWRDDCIAELEKRNAALAFALYGKQQMEKIEGESRV